MTQSGNQFRLQGYEMMWLAICGYLLFINAASFGLFAIDKSAARRGEWRIAESTLLVAALIGGTVGAIAAQQFLRHKTRKEPFRTMLYTIVVMQFIAFGILIYKPTRQASFYCLFNGNITTSDAWRFVDWAGCRK
jgi:uncharacterized membrane protein YsdA (DUF1294 family)